MIIDIILQKYPGIQGVSYWSANQDGTPLKDPYDGLVWDNQAIPKPSKKEFNDWINDSSLIASITIKSYIPRLQNYINSQAQSRQYDSGDSLAGYANSTINQWANEAKAFIAWRDQVWVKAINVQTQILSGEIPIPASLEDFIATLPLLDWNNY